MGLAEVAVETVPVDGWRLLGAASPSTGGAVYECASMGGAPPTPAGGVLAPLVDVGTGERRRLDRLDVAGRIALLDWQQRASPIARDRPRARAARSAGHHPQLPRGRPVLPVAERALGSFALALVRRRAAVRDDVQGGRRGAARGPSGAPAGGAPHARRRAHASARPAATWLATCRARERGAPIVVGAHHDGWFSAAFDNAPASPPTLALARALASAGHRPRAHALLHLAHGRGVRPDRQRRTAGAPGAWGQISETHPDWGAGCALPPQPRGERPPGAAPPDRGAAGADALGPPPRPHRRDRGLAHERLVHASARRSPAPRLWPFLISGVPSVSAYTWERSFMRTDYHTQYDTAGIVDFAHLERLCRFYALLLLSADADPGGILDHAARARELARLAARPGDPGSRARRGGRAAPRRARAERLHADRPRAPRPRRARHDDVSAHPGRARRRAPRGRRSRRSRATTAAPPSGSSRASATTASRASSRRRSSPSSASAGALAHPRASWGARSHPPVSPNLWQELAALRASRARERRRRGSSARSSATSRARAPSSRAASRR